MQNRLKNNETQKYLVGNKLTIADVDMTSIAFSYVINEKNSHC